MPVFVTLEMVDEAVSAIRTLLKRPGVGWILGSGLEIWLNQFNHEASYLTGDPNWTVSTIHATKGGLFLVIWRTSRHDLAGASAFL